MKLKILTVHMGRMDNIAQRQWSDNPFSSTVASARGMALQAGRNSYFLGHCQRCPVWGNLRMLLSSCFRPLTCFIRQGELTGRLIDELMTGRAASSDLIQSWELDCC
jgi:hypothetical protein